MKNKAIIQTRQYGFCLVVGIVLIAAGYGLSVISLVENSNTLAGSAPSNDGTSLTLLGYVLVAYAALPKLIDIIQKGRDVAEKHLSANQPMGES